MNGKFVISLDFELHWGIFDIKSVKDYKQNLDNVREVVYKLVELSNRYNVRLTFSTVGILFAGNKKELESFFPSRKPSFIDKKLSAYNSMDIVGKNELEDPYHYAQEVIKNLSKDDKHEIGSHTFSHYYCREEGQDIKEFEADVIAAQRIGKHLDVTIKSLVFPRNQVRDDYLRVCLENGIITYRGAEKGIAYSPKMNGKNSVISRIVLGGLRLLDCYVNVFGTSTYPVSGLKSNSGECINLPSSRFLRPYNKKLRHLEPLKLRRIKNAMTYAAKKNELYHLWWHPHNFGMNMKQNFDNLENIFKHFEYLNEKYSFESETMTSLGTKLISK